MGLANIHIGKDIWRWRAHTGKLEIRDPNGKKTMVSFASFGFEYGDEARSIVPSEIRRYIESVILAPPDGVKCLTCYGKGTCGTKGRFHKCVVCDGTGRREPNIVPKW